MVHQWTVWCIIGLCGKLDGASVYCVTACVVHQCDMWCISRLCKLSVPGGVSVFWMVHQWIVWCIIGLWGILDGASVDCLMHHSIVWCIRWCISVLCHRLCAEG